MEGGAERFKRSFGSEEGGMHVPQARCGQWEGADHDPCLTWGPGHRADPRWVGGCPSQCPHFLPHDLALSQTSWHAHTLTHTWILPCPFTHKDTQSCISQRVPGHAAVTSIPSAPAHGHRGFTHTHCLAHSLPHPLPHTDTVALYVRVGWITLAASSPKSQHRGALVAHFPLTLRPQHIQVWAPLRPIFLPPGPPCGLSLPVAVTQGREHHTLALKGPSESEHMAFAHSVVQSELQGRTGRPGSVSLPAGECPPSGAAGRGVHSDTQRTPSLAYSLPPPPTPSIVHLPTYAQCSRILSHVLFVHTHTLLHTCAPVLSAILPSFKHAPLELLASAGSLSH